MALFVERLLLRSALSEAQQAAVLSLPGRIQKVPPSHEIILPGQHTDHSCLIVSGLGARLDMMADGRR
ncbi:MAG: Crp/Fnr family transcriptional regulator, partial [Croceibacterium sp.]